MKKNTLLLFSFIAFSSAVLQAQSIEKIDSLSTEICHTLEKNITLDAKERMQQITQIHIDPFVKKNIQNINVDEFADKLFYRLQKNCLLFSKLLEESTENKSDWKIIDQFPTFKLSDKECAVLYDSKNFYYKEFSGAIVNVNLENNIWLEKFEDGTYSKLHFKKDKNCTFILEFIESNNLSRKNFSVKGDLYKYQIFDRKDNVYAICTQNEKDKSILEFKIYIK